MNAPVQIASLLEGIKIIDVDTHYSEPHDLWTKRAPASLKHLVPRVEVVDGKRSWVIGEKTLLGGLGACPISAIRKDGSKSRQLEFMTMQIEDVHRGAYDIGARVKEMDDSHIFAQVVYPNILGFGGQNGWTADEKLRFASIEIFNDAMADMQRESNGRIYPMALMPWWSLERSVAEVKRAHNMGLRGVIINSDPQDKGLPDLADRFWDPLWEACTTYNMPINFHIGASESSMAWIGNSKWQSMPVPMQFVATSCMLFFGNARVMTNILLSGILDRHPTIKFVSVESGMGWIPFLLESLEYQIAENAAGSKHSLTPREYFLRNIYACYWFENRFLGDVIRHIGVDNVMFETDFPHPTCLYPSPLEIVAPGLAQLDVASRRKVLSENAAKLYSIPIDG